MAKITYSALVSEISGSIGPLTFRRSNSGSVMQDRPATKRQDTQAMCLHKIYVSQANKDWANLDQDSKKFWKQAADFELTRGRFALRSARNARLFYLGWRIRCLHAGASCAYDTLPPLPIFQDDYFRMVLFSPGLSVSWYNFPLGGTPPYPRCSAWISWPVNGVRRTGRRWFKFWPVAGQENKAYGVDLDSVLYDVMGYPPELTAMVSGYYPYKAIPRVRSYGVYASGQIGIMPERDIQPSGAQYYFKIPPDPPVFGGIAP